MPIYVCTQHTTSYVPLLLLNTPMFSFLPTSLVLSVLLFDVEFPICNKMCKITYVSIQSCNRVWNNNWLLSDRFYLILSCKIHFGRINLLYISSREAKDSKRIQLKTFLFYRMPIVMYFKFCLSSLISDWLLIVTYAPCLIYRFLSLVVFAILSSSVVVRSPLVASCWGAPTSPSSPGLSSQHPAISAAHVVVSAVE